MIRVGIILALLAATPAAAQTFDAKTFDPEKVRTFLANLGAPAPAQKVCNPERCEQIGRDFAAAKAKALAERRKRASDLYAAQTRAEWLQLAEHDIADDKLCSEWAASRHIIDSGKSYRRCRDRLDATWTER